MENKTLCQIEHHATLYALFSKYIFEAYGEDGAEVAQQLAALYGKERGARMAKTALANGDDLSIINNQAYGEWKPNYPGQMTFGITQGEPSLQTYISKCAWCEAWRKHDLLDYGKHYCEVVDNAVFQGFNPDYVCTIIGTTMSWGGECCKFDWEANMTTEELEALAAKKQALGSRFMKDFNYHTAHMYYTGCKFLQNYSPSAQTDIIEPVIAEYIQLFGQEYFDVLLPFESEIF